VLCVSEKYLTAHTKKSNSKFYTCPILGIVGKK